MDYSVVVKVDPGFLTSGTTSPGHAWIEVYGPGGAGPNGLIGAYGFAPKVSGFTGEGVVNNEGIRQFQSPNGYTSPHIPLAINQYTSLMAFVLLRQQTPGEYNAAFRNCTFFVREALSMAALPISKQGAPGPESLLFGVQGILAALAGGGGGGGENEGGGVPMDDHGAPLEYEITTYDLVWTYQDGWSLVYEMNQFGDVISKEWVAPPSDPKGGLGDSPVSGWRFQPNLELDLATVDTPTRAAVSDADQATNSMAARLIEASSRFSMEATESQRPFELESGFGAAQRIVGFGGRPDSSLAVIAI